MMSEDVPSVAADWCIHLLSQIRQQRSNDDRRCDTRLVLDCGIYFHAHSIILAASSPVLCSALTAGNKWKGCEFDYCAKIPGISSKTLSHVLDFLYTGKLHCDFVHLDDVHSLATKLDIKMLVNFVKQLLRKSSEQNEYDCVKEEVDASENVTFNRSVRGKCTTGNVFTTMELPDGEYPINCQTVPLQPDAETLMRASKLHVKNYPNVTSATSSVHSESQNSIKVKEKHPRQSDMSVSENNITSKKPLRLIQIKKGAFKTCKTNSHNDSHAFCKLTGKQLAPAEDSMTHCERIISNKNRDDLEMNCDISKGWKATENKFTDHRDVSVTSDVTSDPGEANVGVTSDVTSGPGVPYGGVDVTSVNELRSTARDEGHIHQDLEDVATDQDMICDDVEDSEAAEPPEDSELPGAPKDTEAALPADQTQDNRYDDDINETRITDQRGLRVLRCSETSASGGVERWELSGPTENIPDNVEKPKKRRKRKGPTAYMLWCNENRPLVLAENPGLDFAVITKQLGQLWQATPHKEKILWRRKAERRAAKGVTTLKPGRKPTAKKQLKPAKTAIARSTAKRQPKSAEAVGSGSSAVQSLHERIKEKNKLGPSGYKLWCSRNRVIVDPENPRIVFFISWKEMAKKWKAMPEKQKLLYQREAKRIRTESITKLISEHNKEQEKLATNITTPTKKKQVKTSRNLISNMLSPGKKIPGKNDIKMINSCKKKQGRNATNIIKGENMEQGENDTLNSTKTTQVDLSLIHEWEMKGNHANQLTEVSELHPSPELDPRQDPCESTIVAESGSASRDEYKRPSAVKLEERPDKKKHKAGDDVVRSGATSWCCHVMSSLNQQRSGDGKRCDTSLTIDSGSTFLTHSAILSLACPKLSDDLSIGRKSKTKKLEYCLGDVTKSTMSNLLDFFYTGKMSCDIKHLEDIRLLADKLEVKKLVDDVTNIKMQMQLLQEDDEDDNVTKEENDSHAEKIKDISSSYRTCNGSVNWCCHLMAMMNQQRFDDSGSCDTILTTTSGTSFAAHSIILAASSPLLNVELPVHVLCESSYSSSLGDVASLTVTNVLEFLYTGNLRCGIDSLDDVRILAEKVGVTKLVESVTKLQMQLRSVKHVGADVRSDIESITNGRNGAHDQASSDDMARIDPLTTGDATHTNHRQQCVSANQTGKTVMPPVNTKIKTMYQHVLTDHNYPMVKTEDDDPITSSTPDNTANMGNTSNVENNTAPLKFPREGSYYCRFCPKKFIKRVTLFDHENRHQNIKAYKCKYANCDKAFFKRFRLLLHQDEQHTGFLPYQCDVCNMRFNISSNFEKHKELHIRDENSWTCTICQMNCKSKQNLSNHQKAEHGGENLPIKCESCTKSFQLPEQLRMHMRHHKKTEHICSDCGKMCVSKSKLQHHMLRHQPATCSLCSLVFKGKVSLNMHRRKCPPTKKEQKCKKKKKQLNSEYKCSECKKSFSNKEVLEDHIRPDKCDICSKIISCSARLLRHKFTVHNEKAYLCAKCPKAFTSVGALSWHKQTHSERSYSCDKCPRAFRSVSGLSWHKRTHGERNYLCDKCPRAFTCNTNLVSHKLTHSERTFSCDKCPRAFRCNSHLAQHLKSHKERQYICHLCNKGFWRKFDLEVHERTHTGEKPFMCSVCAECFISNRALEGHELMHRPKEHKCETCGKEFRLLKPYQKHINEHENVTKQKAASKHDNKSGNTSWKKRRLNAKSVNNKARVMRKKRKLDLINDSETENINMSEVTPDFEDEHLSVNATISGGMDAQQTLDDEVYSSEGTTIESEDSKRSVAIEDIPQLYDVSGITLPLDHRDETEYAAFDTFRALTEQL